MRLVRPTCSVRRRAPSHLRRGHHQKRRLSMASRRDALLSRTVSGVAPRTAPRAPPCAQVCAWTRFLCANERSRAPGARVRWLAREAHMQPPSPPPRALHRCGRVWHCHRRVLAVHACYGGTQRLPGETGDPPPCTPFKPPHARLCMAGLSSADATKRPVPEQESIQGERRTAGGAHARGGQRPCEGLLRTAGAHMRLRSRTTRRAPINTTTVRMDMNMLSRLMAMQQQQQQGAAAPVCTRVRGGVLDVVGRPRAHAALAPPRSP